MKTITMLLVILVTGCSLLPPVGGNYPYDMYDKDVSRVMEILEKGDKTGLWPELLVNEKSGLEFVKAYLWGKIERYSIVDKKYVRMTGHYWIDVELTDGKTMQIRVSYLPNVGRMELSIHQMK